MSLSCLMRSMAMSYSSGRYWPSTLARLSCILGRDQLAAEDRRFFQVRLLAVADLAGAEPVGDGDEFDLGDEVGHLDQRGALALAGLDALIVAGRVQDAAVQEQGEIGHKPAVLLPARLKPGIKDPAEGALAGPEADHRGVQPDGSFIIGSAVVGGRCRQTPSRGRAGPSRHEVECRPLVPPKASATFCWAITGSIA